MSEPISRTEKLFQNKMKQDVQSKIQINSNSIAKVCIMDIPMLALVAMNKENFFIHTRNKRCEMGRRNFEENKFLIGLKIGLYVSRIKLFHLHSNELGG